MSIANCLALWCTKVGRISDLKIISIFFGRGCHPGCKGDTPARGRRHCPRAMGPDPFGNCMPQCRATGVDFDVFMNSFYIASVLQYYRIHCLLNTDSLFCRLALRCTLADSSLDSILWGMHKSSLLAWTSCPFGQFV